MRKVRSLFLVEDIVKRGERRSRLCLLFETNTLFEKRLVAPVNGSVAVSGELSVEFGRVLIILGIVCADLEKDVGLAAQRLSLLRRTRVAVQHFIIQNKRVLHSVQLPFDGSLLVARRPF